MPDQRSENVQDDIESIRFPKAGQLSRFAQGMFICGLVLSCLRVGMVVLASIGYSAIKQEQADHPLLTAIRWEIVAGSLIFASGIPANILLLMKKRMALKLGWGFLAASIASLAVGLWQSSIQFRQLAADSPERSNAWIGFGVALTLNVAFIMMYATAMKQAESELT